MRILNEIARGKAGRFEGWKDLKVAEGGQRKRAERGNSECT
jgi:hypothetical protein